MPHAQGEGAIFNPFPTTLGGHKGERTPKEGG